MTLTLKIPDFPTSTSALLALSLLALCVEWGLGWVLKDVEQDPWLCPLDTRSLTTHQQYILRWLAEDHSFIICYCVHLSAYVPVHVCVGQRAPGGQRAPAGTSSLLPCTCYPPGFSKTGSCVTHTGIRLSV